MPSFQHLQNQGKQKSQESKFPNQTLNLSGILDYAESAKKQNFESLCRIEPLVKTYRNKIEETAQAMTELEASLGPEAEIPEDYAAALAPVKESFATHLGALDDWMKVLRQKDESNSEKALTRVKQSGALLETSLKGLSIPS